MTRAATGSRPDPTTAPAIATTSTASPVPVPAGTADVSSTPSDQVVRTVGRVSGDARFAALGRTRHRVRSGPLRVSWVPAGADDGTAPPACVAYAIGRKVGSAVVRNRLRRRLRAILSELRPPAGDYLVATDPAAASLPFSDLKALVSTALSTLSPTRS